MGVVGCHPEYIYTFFNISQMINLKTPTYLIAVVQPFRHLNLLTNNFHSQQFFVKIAQNEGEMSMGHSAQTAARVVGVALG